MEQHLLPEDLLPVYPETFWERCLFQAMLLVQSRWKPFKCDIFSCRCGLCRGSSQDFIFRDKLILNNNNEFCCDNGAVFEVFMLAWRYFLGDDYETDKDLLIWQIDELFRRCFMIESLDIYSSEYPLGFISGLLKIPSWLNWLNGAGISVLEIDDVRDLKFGDFCRIQDGEDPRDGSTVIIIGEGWEHSNPVVYTWSAHKKYDRKWIYGEKMNPGHGCSYYYINNNNNGWDRKFYAARIVDQIVPFYCDTIQILSQ